MVSLDLRPHTERGGSQLVNSQLLGQIAVLDSLSFEASPRSPCPPGIHVCYTLQSHVLRNTSPPVTVPTGYSIAPTTLLVEGWLRWLRCCYGGDR